MTTGEAVVAALEGSAAVTALVGTRIYPNKAPAGSTKFPLIVYQVVSDVPQDSFTNAPGGTVNARVQIDCYSSSAGGSGGYLQAHQVADTVESVLAALAQPNLSVWREISRDLYDDVAELHRVQSDYSFWRG